MLTDEEVAALCPKPIQIPSAAYLPFGWAVAGVSETARAIAIANHGAQTMMQLSIALLFLAAESH